VHIAWHADDVMAEVERVEALGFDTVHLNEDQEGFPIAWVDARSVFGTMVEIFQENPRRRQRYRAIAQAATDWTGDNPVRETFPTLSPDSS